MSLQTLKTKLPDMRSRKIILIAHCILNQNTRYFGGASHPGAQVQALRELLQTECGIIQLPCPETSAWGGIDKKLIWMPMMGFRRMWSLFAPLALPLFRVWTRFNYSLQAERVTREIQRMIHAGIEIVSITGIDGSPTCGVNHSLDMRACFAYHATVDTEKLTSRSYNGFLYQKALRKGKGLFMEILEKKLRCRDMTIPFSAYNLAHEPGILSPACNGR